MRHVDHKSKRLCAPVRRSKAQDLPQFCLTGTKKNDRLMTVVPRTQPCFPPEKGKFPQ